MYLLEEDPIAVDIGIKTVDTGDRVEVLEIESLLESKICKFHI